MIGRWLARRQFRRAGPRRPPVSSEIAPELGERPDPAARRAFLAGHVLIHTHVPKTGGSALSAALSAIVGGVHTVDVRLSRSLRLEGLDRDDLDDLYLVAGHFGYGMHSIFDRVPLYLAALRDPVDRAVSTYRYMIEHPDQPEGRLIAGLDFETAWRRMDEHYGPARHNLQARYLTGSLDQRTIDADFLWQQLDEGYFLLIPHRRIGDAVQRLRAAFGVPWARVHRMNVSRAEPVTPSAGMSRLIRQTDALDCELYRRVEDGFDPDLARAAEYIASRCLAPLKPR